MIEKFRTEMDVISQIYHSLSLFNSILLNLLDKQILINWRKKTCRKIEIAKNEENQFFTAKKKMCKNCPVAPSSLATRAWVGRGKEFDCKKRKHEL